jgi:dTDP-4-dehydrorhamnose reductase
MRIFVFGANGMLGHYIVDTLNCYNVIPVTRRMFDATSDDISEFLKDITENDIVINCIGAIPQKSPTTREYIQLNTLFPLKLEELMKEKRFIFIHITTDCVFDGKKGRYIETDAHTATDVYGITKSLGEPKDACVIRTSIIGEELTLSLIHI